MQFPLPMARFQKVDDGEAGVTCSHTVHEERAIDCRALISSESRVFFPMPNLPTVVLSVHNSGRKKNTLRTQTRTHYTNDVGKPQVLFLGEDKLYREHEIMSLLFDFSLHFLES